jgi:hypothetical protein
VFQTDPEVVRKEVIPTLIRMGQEGRARGTVNEEQFREFMSQVNNHLASSIYNTVISFF